MARLAGAPPPRARGGGGGSDRAGGRRGAAALPPRHRSAGDRSPAWGSRRVEAPVVLCLEAHRPLQFVLSQGLVVFAPMLAMLFGAAPIEKITLLMQERANLDRLIHRIEALAQERGRGVLVDG